MILRQWIIIYSRKTYFSCKLGFFPSDDITHFSRKSCPVLSDIKSVNLFIFQDNLLLLWVGIISWQRRRPFLQKNMSLSDIKAVNSFIFKKHISFLWVEITSWQRRRPFLQKKLPLNAIKAVNSFIFEKNFFPVSWDYFLATKSTISVEKCAPKWH